jgi:hypothetical protein
MKNQDISIKWVRINAYTWVLSPAGVPDSEVRAHFAEKQKHSIYYNPKKYFTIK